MRTQLPIALLLASTAVACVDEAATDVDTVATALEQENGGLDMDDEAPMFGDEVELQAAAPEAAQPATDPIATDPTVTTMEADPAARVIDVVVMWGHLRPDRANTTVRDWSGTLGLNRGAMIVKRTIAFEDRGDGLAPRTARDVVAFRSHTAPASDGLVLRIIDPTPDAGPLTLTFGPANETPYVFDDLGALREGPMLGDLGNGDKIVAVAHRRGELPADCARGTVRGRWHDLAPNVHAFRGLVTNADGDPVGHLKGIAGERRSGERALFGKFIDREGQFKGLIVGDYASGEFRGVLVDRMGRYGAIHGLYFDGAQEDGGGFIGRWAQTERCQAN